MDSYDILVILLSVALGISLIVWITVGVLTIQVLKKIKNASDTARTAVEHVEEFTSHLKNAGKATAVGSIVAQIAKAFKGRK
jgi:ribosomal protein L18